MKWFRPKLSQILPKKISRVVIDVYIFSHCVKLFCYTFFGFMFFWFDIFFGSETQFIHLLWMQIFEMDFKYYGKSAKKIITARHS